MIRFKATLVNELEKLHKNKKVLAAIILSIVFIILGQIFILLLRNNFGLKGASSTEFPLLVLSTLINTLLPLFIALITIDSFSGEFSQNTMKISLTKPVTRLKLFTVKIVAIIIFIFMTLMTIMLFSIISGIIFNTNSFTVENLIKIVISYVVTLMPMTILCLIIVLFANILKNGIAVFFLSILVFIISKVLAIFFPTYSGILFTSMIGWHALWIMDNIPYLKIFRNFMMMLSYAIILFTAGYYIFDKKDL
ncbi:ABC transporter permease [Clostridium sp. WILCCON 0269]|uniref:ABC transporter permease n=1 Tax=Candidatus Clostridium eludens TaxID=3381663 RepID=A0ABW8SG66_9CLOT